MRVIAFSPQIDRNFLDDNYTLHDNGEVLHEYDRSTYPGGQNFKETLSVDQLNENVKKRLLEAASDSDKELVRKILGLY